MDVIGDKELAAVILMVLVTTILTPSLLKLAFSDKKETSKKAVA